MKYIECIRTKSHINLILEYVENGSLHQMVKQSGKMGEHLVFIFVKQILEGLAYLHNQGIIHRDIKGANLLLTKNGVVKLADFGYSILNDKNKVNSIVGTACFMAPEVIEQKGNISPKCDIWSLGCTIIQLLTTRPPYYEFEPMAAMFRIVTDDCPPIPSGISPGLKDFLLKCFMKEPAKRPTAKELLSHPWITTPNKKLVKKFINDNNNSYIPINLINEWKNNYRNILASNNSSQNNNRLASKNITEDYTQKSNSIIKNCDYNTLIEQNMKNNEEEKNKLEKEIELLLGSFNLDKNNILNKRQNLEESINIEESKVNNEDLYLDNKNNFNDIINNLIILEYNTNFNNDKNDEKIYYNKKIVDKKEYFLMNINNISSFLKDKKSINDCINDLEISQFINLFSSKYMTSKSLLLLLKYLNIILLEKPDLIKDILINQIIFHLSKYICIFLDINIKIQISIFVYNCLISKSIIELFISSNGIFLLNILLNSEFLKGKEIIITILTLNYILYMYILFGNEISPILINNKILPRLNLLLIDLQSIENNADFEINKNKLLLVSEKIFLILMKLTTNINNNYLYIICNDKILITLSQVLINLDSSKIENIIQIFDNLMVNTNNLNKLEKIGFIDILLKLLNKFCYSSNLSDNNSSQKIIKKILNQINQVIKLSKSRSELFVMSDGVNIICSLANIYKGNEIIYQIISILSELINTTNFNMNKLKQSKALELIIKLLIGKKDSKIIKELTQIILNWMEEDKVFIEKYIIRDDKFHSLFKNLSNILNDNEIEFIQLLNDFFKASEEVTNKFFSDDNLLSEIIEKIENSPNNKDIHFMNKVMDFYLLLIKYKKKEIKFLNRINFKKIIEKIKSISKERHLIIIEEKIKKIETLISTE